MAGTKRRLEYMLLSGETAFSLWAKVDERSREDWRIVIGSFQATTFGFFIWLERFSAAQD